MRNYELLQRNDCNISFKIKSPEPQEFGTLCLITRNGLFNHNGCPTMLILDSTILDATKSFVELG